MVANEGYVQGKVNFSCRVARCARASGREVDIIRMLREYASLDNQDAAVKKEEAEEEVVVEASSENAVVTGAESEEHKKRPLLERLGDNFARGHVQASGGIVDVEEFEELMRLMRIGEKSDAAKRKEEEKSKGGPSPQKGKSKAIDPGQKNTLAEYFKKPVVSQIS